jgi:hypothetical protein
VDRERLAAATLEARRQPVAILLAELIVHDTHPAGSPSTSREANRWPHWDVGLSGVRRVVVGRSLTPGVLESLVSASRPRRFAGTELVADRETHAHVSEVDRGHHVGDVDVAGQCAVARAERQRQMLPDGLRESTPDLPAWRGTPD